MPINMHVIQIICCLHIELKSKPIGMQRTYAQRRKQTQGEPLRLSQRRRGKDYIFICFPIIYERVSRTFEELLCSVRRVTNSVVGRKLRL